MRKLYITVASVTIEVFEKRALRWFPFQGWGGPVDLRGSTICWTKLAFYGRRAV